MTRDLPPIAFQPIEGMEVEYVPYYEWLIETVPPLTGWEDTLKEPLHG